MTRGWGYIAPVNTKSDRTAVIIGASSGIGEALAREWNRKGWRLGLLARRLDALDTLAREFGADTVVRRVDVTQADAATILEDVIQDLGGVDLIIVSAGTGHLNPDLNWELDLDTVRVNVVGFMAMTQVAMRYFLKRGRGQFAIISAVAGWVNDQTATAARPIHDPLDFVMAHLRNEIIPE